MSIKLAFLGSGTCNSSTNNPPSLALTNGDEIVLIDIGGGAYHQLSRINDPDFNYKKVSTIFITHFHVDHISGLPDFLWGEMWDYTGRRDKPLNIIGPHGLKNFYNDRLLPFMGDYPLPFDVDLHEIADGEIYTGTFYSAKSYHLSHGEYSTGYLFEMEGIKLVVTGDTGYCENLMNLLREADEAVMEWGICDYIDYPGHLSSSDIIKIIKTGIVPKRMYINHMYLLQGQNFEQLKKKNIDILEGYADRFVFPKDMDVFKLT